MYLLVQKLLPSFFISAAYILSATIFQFQPFPFNVENPTNPSTSLLSDLKNSTPLMGSKRSDFGDGASPGFVFLSLSLRITCVFACS